MFNDRKNVIMFLLGGAIGSLVTYFIVKDKYESQYEEITEETEKETAQQCAVTTNDKYVRLTKEYKPRTTPLNERQHPLDDDEEKDDDYVMGDVRTKAHQRNKYISPEPFIISIDDFEDPNSTFDKITINYYEDDETLVDESEEPVVDVTAMIGPDALNSFGFKSRDPEIVYVRNEKLEIDYEVIRLSKSYAKSVLGYEE